MTFEIQWASAKKGLTTLANNLARHRDDADDLLQETAIRCAKSFKDYEGDRPFANWAMRIMSRIWLDELRRRGRRPRTLSLDSPIAGPDGEMQHEFADDTPLPSAKYDTSRLGEAVAKALREIPPAFADALIATEVYEMSYKQAATRFNVCLSTFRCRRHRAVNRARRIATQILERA